MSLKRLQIVFGRFGWLSSHGSIKCSSHSSPDCQTSSHKCSTLDQKSTAHQEERRPLLNLYAPRQNLRERADSALQLYKPGLGDLGFSQSGRSIGQNMGRAQQKRLDILKKRWIRQQFREVFKSGGEEKGKELLDKLLRSEIVENADLFLEELVHDKLLKLDYGNAFSSWARYALLERTIAGADQLLEFVLREKNGIRSVQQSRIKGICEKIQHLFTPSDAFAECVSAYLANDRYEEAKVLATFYVISPRSFVNPVRRLVDKHNPQLIELFSRLFREIYVPTAKQKKKKTEKPQLSPTEARSKAQSEEQTEARAEEHSKAKSEAQSEEPAVEEDPRMKEAQENVKFLLQSRRRKKYKYMAKKPKLKKYEVDPRQLDILMRTFKEVDDEIKSLATSTS